MTKCITVFGGSGFIGRYIVTKAARRGWRVRVAMRYPNQALFLKTAGVVGQIDTVLCNVRYPESVGAVLDNTDTVVNCVGVLTESDANTFSAVHHHAVATIAQSAAQHKIKHCVQISAIGASTNANNRYARSKAQGEIALQRHFPNATILRPSIVFGAEDQFFNRFAAMARIAPLLPIVAAKTRFQPVYVGDVADAVIAAVETPENAQGVFELGGADIMTFRDLMALMLKIIHRKKIIFDVPIPMAFCMAIGLDLSQKITGGLFHNRVLTRDQIHSLQSDNIVQDGARGLSDLGVDITALKGVLERYLWHYRPFGQFERPPIGNP